MNNFHHTYMLPTMLAGLLGGCGIIETVPPADGDDEYVFACSKVTGQPACEARAQEACPSGYETLSSEKNFNRKELRVRCLEGRN